MTSVTSIFRRARGPFAPQTQRSALYVPLNKCVFRNIISHRPSGTKKTIKHFYKTRSTRHTSLYGTVCDIMHINIHISSAEGTANHLGPSAVGGVRVCVLMRPIP